MSTVESPPTEHRKKALPKWDLYVVVLIVLILIGGLSFPGMHFVGPQARIVKARTDTENLTTALDQYAIEYGYHPEGTPSEILRTLRGGNTREIVFFECRTDAVNPRGEMIDPWGQPYHFDQSDSSKPRVYSSGPNKIDDRGAKDSDDIVGNSHLKK